MQTIYRTKAIRLDSGERFPLLVECDTELPVLDVVDFSLAYHRTKSINSSKSRVGAIGLFLEWAEACLIDIDERFGSGDLFSQAEIESLATALGQSKRKKVIVGDQVLPGNVLGDTQANRVDWVTEYIRWRATGVAQAMKINDTRVLAINQRLEQIEKQLKALKRKGAGKVRLGLTEEQQVRLFEIVRPDSPENPYYAETRYRNFMLFLLFYELGIRRAESLVLKANHVHLHQNPRITIEPNPGDPIDPRKDQPLVKTAGRTLPISTLLAQTIHTYITKHRSQVPGAKKSPFIVLESRSGQPLSLASVYDMFVVIRERFPDDFPSDFSTHVLRHTWNDRFMANAKARGLKGALAQQVNNYIMGWAKTSQQSVKYSQREIERQASQLLMGMQQQLSEFAL